MPHSAEGYMKFWDNDSVTLRFSKAMKDWVCPPKKLLLHRAPQFYEELVGDSAFVLEETSVTTRGTLLYYIYTGGVPETLYEDDRKATVSHGPTEESNVGSSSNAPETETKPANESVVRPWLDAWLFAQKHRIPDLQDLLNEKSQKYPWTTDDYSFVHANARETGTAAPLKLTANIVLLELYANGEISDDEYHLLAEQAGTSMAATLLSYVCEDMKRIRASVRKGTQRAARKSQKTSGEAARIFEEVVREASTDEAVDERLDALAKDVVAREAKEAKEARKVADGKGKGKQT